MTVRELIKKLVEMDMDKKVYLGVQGYETDIDGDYIGVYDGAKAVLIADNCYYEEIDD